MDEITYLNNGHALAERAKTDRKLARQLAEATFDLVTYLAIRYRDPEVAIEIQEIIAVRRKIDEPLPSRAEVQGAGKAAKDLVVASRQRLGKDCELALLEEEGLAPAEKAKRRLERQDRAFRATHTLNCLVAVIEMGYHVTFDRLYEATLVFWDEIFRIAPAVLMELEQEEIDYGNEVSMRKYRDTVWEIIGRRTGG